MRLPDFLIVGAMRSGTTALTRYLDGHPQVAMSRPKEIHFLDRHWERGTAWYAEHFDPHADLVGEATQTYLYDDRVPARLASVVPEARLVAVLRDPVDRAYSHYWLERSRGREPLSFEEALDREPERLARGDAVDRANFSYVDRGRYLPQLQRLVEHCPDAPLHLLVFEDLVAEPAPSFSTLCRFLGVDDGVRPEGLGEPVNRYVSFRSLAVRDFVKRRGAWAERLVGRFNSRGGSYPPMRLETRARLAASFVADNAALARWLGRSLPWSGL